MADPERLLNRAPESALGRLLRAGGEERPTHAAMQRTLAAVGVGGALVGVAGGAQAAGAVAGGGSAAAGAAAASGSGAALGKASVGVALLKWVGAGVVAGGLATGVAHVATTNPPAPSPAPPAVATNTPPVSPQPAAPKQPLAPAPVALEEPARSSGQTAPVHSSQPQSQLSAELSALQRAKSLSATNPARALLELDEYRSKFPQGTMKFEASFLGMQTAQRAGQPELARSYAREVLAIQPRGPQADQAHAVLGQ